MIPSSAPAVQPATLDDEEAVAHLFEALHMQNAALDARFAWHPAGVQCCTATLHAPGTRPARAGGSRGLIQSRWG
ncbi:MAG: hypothetical protein HC893_12500 [Chloroflexaceae bacterium]|nr:hypothetical protein [Chloroflexaceae bacterium]